MPGEKPVVAITRADCSLSTDAGKDPLPLKYFSDFYVRRLVTKLSEYAARTPHSNDEHRELLEGAGILRPEEQFSFVFA